MPPRGAACETEPHAEPEWRAAESVEPQSGEPRRRGTRRRRAKSHELWRCPLFARGQWSVDEVIPIDEQRRHLKDLCPKEADCA